ncbi:hypothetical protein JKF63_02329 [Porcisia hertigi]|uniref:Tyrosyl-DNA phosphodiesterase 1 n=1 Tax=Porcisia hertigi TaxID=2761500 RepID=A0A836I7Z3_9TRYP|nr:hypothetical protein JKF63_02329 [Porcisia hertigi]
MSGCGIGRPAETGFPFWVNDVDAFAFVPGRDATSPCSLLRLRDLFRCNLADPTECWQYVLLSSYKTDFRWLLATVPELSAVTGKLVMLSGEKGTATLRRTAGKASSPFTTTSPLLDHRNPFLTALREHTQSASVLDAPLPRDRLAVLEPPLPLAFGTHHTKMAMCVNGKGLRVSIFTANLLEQDWCWKSQGIYVQDFPWKRVAGIVKNHSAGSTTGSGTASSCSNGTHDSSTSTKGTAFVEHLRHYLVQCGVGLSAAFVSLEAATAAGPLGIFETDFFSHIDFSAAAVWLVSSVPGTYLHGEVCPGYRVGLCRLAEVLRLSEPTRTTAPARVDLSWQYSSQGSLNQAFLNSLQAVMCGESVSLIESGEAPSGVRDVKVVYPTEEEVRNSWEGWRGGGSLPLRAKCCHEFVNERLHRWGGNADFCSPRPELQQSSKLLAAHTSREDALDVDGVDSDGGEEVTASRVSSCAPYWQFSMPHIKSYAAVTLDRSSIHWFLLTSMNLSQAAWGAVGGRVKNRDSRQQVVRSYELGVLYDSHSVIDPSASPLFSVVANSVIELPTARNSRDVLYETPLGIDARRVCVYLPYNLLRPVPFASTVALQAHRRACNNYRETITTATALDCRDVPWVVDMPHQGCDAYGCQIGEAFERTDPLPLSKWVPRLRDTATAPLLSAHARRKRRREA